LLAWDEAPNTNPVVVGSPDANSRLRQLPPLQQFDFKSLRDEPRQGMGGIVAQHPRPGKEPVYFASGRPYTSHFASVAMLPGPAESVPGRYLLRAIDHQEVHWRLLRFHNQAHLIAHRRDEDRRVQGIWLTLIWRQVQREIEISRHAGPVHNYTIEMS
jgi:hypothetical protein